MIAQTKIEAFDVSLLMKSPSLNQVQKKEESSTWGTFTDTLSIGKTACSNYSKGAIEGLKIIVPVSLSLGWVADTILDINSCRAHKALTSSLSAPFLIMVIFGPIYEEVLCRGIFQSYASKFIFEAYMKYNKLNPREKEQLTRKHEKQARIYITSFYFGLLHLLNYQKEISGFVYAQTVAAFFIGNLLGNIAESKLGLAGACGAHSINNLVAYVASQYLCE